MKHPASALLAAIAPAPYLWGGALALSLTLERILVVAATVLLVSSTREGALVVTGAIAALFALRGVARGILRARVRTRIHDAAIDALFRGDLVRPSPLEGNDVHNAVFNGTQQGVRILAELLPDLAGDAVAVCALSLYIVAVEPAHVVLVGGAALIVAAGAIVAARRVTEHAFERAWSAYSPVLEDLIVAVGARLELVANGREESFRAQAERRIQDYRRVAARSERFAAAAGRAPILAAALVVGVAVVVEQSLRGPLDASSVGQAAIFASVVPAFTGMARGAHEIVKQAAVLHPIAELLRSESGPRGGAVAPPPLPTTIAWRSVTYAYGQASGRPSAAAIQDLSITWSPGQILLLAGPNGSGKSTCVRLLLGLARPQGGEITVGGVDLFTLDLAAWRRQVAYLPQRPFLHDRASVRDAMKMLARDASDETLRAALERIDVWRSLVGRGGSPLDVCVGTLSAGQRQRVAVARVLATDAPLLILDEPDANLDAEGIRLVSAILRELAATRMVAVIAHTDQLIALGDTLVQLSAAA